MGDSVSFPRQNSSGQLDSLSGLEPDVAKQVCILVYGRDLSLLETRCWVLEGAGFHVQATTDFTETMDVFQVQSPDLTILCHSLLAEQQKAILDATRAARPSRKVLVLSGGMDALPHDAETATIDSFDGPRVLLAAVKQMLAQPRA